MTNQVIRRLLLLSLLIVAVLVLRVALSYKGEASPSDTTAMFQRSEADWRKAKDELDTEAWLKKVKTLGREDEYVGTHVEWQGTVADIAITQSFDPTVAAGEWQGYTIVIDVGKLSGFDGSVRALKEDVSEEEVERLSVGQHVKVSGIILETEPVPVLGTVNMYLAKTATIAAQ